MSAPLPTGYTPPETRLGDQVMRDPTAQNLFAQLIQLHEDLCLELDRDVERAAHGAAEPASGYVTGSSDHDQMLGRAAAVKWAKEERARRRKNANQRLRGLIEDYEIELGRRPVRRVRVESIDYQNGAERRYG